MVWRACSRGQLLPANGWKKVVVNLYLDKCPRPPPEIELLVTRIVDRNGNP
jgi:hypothetical protein